MAAQTHQTGKTQPKKKRARIYSRELRPPGAQLPADNRRLIPTLECIRDEANAAGGGDPEKTKAAVWRLLPNSVADLESLANAAAQYRFSLRGTALQKLACLLTAPNRRKWSWDAWNYSQAAQQLFPVWKAGFLREFRFSFKSSLTPAEINDKMSHIRDNIFDKFGFRATYVLAKHPKRKLAQKNELETGAGEKVKSGAKEYTSWHVHGLLWPLAGPTAKPATFRAHYAKLQAAVENSRAVTETFWRKPKDLPRTVAYLAFNYYQACCYRRLLAEKYKPAHEQLPPDAAKGVRLFAVPEQLWLRSGKDRQEPASEGRYSRKRCKKADPRYVYWRTLRGTGRVTPFSKAYRSAAAEMAEAVGLEEDRIEDTFRISSRREIFRRACQDVEDIPRVPTVRGYDGFVYHVIVGNAQWWETAFYLLWRDEVPEDYTLLGQPVPEKLGEVAFPISLHALHKLGQAELSVHVPRANFRPVSPVTGKTPRPMCFPINIPAQVLKAAEIDGALEALWLRRAKKRKIT